MVFSQKVTGLATVLGERDSVLFPTQRLFHKLSIQRRIVRHQDLEFLGRSGHLSSGKLFEAAQTSVGANDAIPQLVRPPWQLVKRAVTVDCRLNRVSPPTAHRGF